MSVLPNQRAGLIGLSLTVTLAASTVSGQAQASGSEHQAVLATVQRLFDAMRTKDSAAFREVFEPNATLFGMRTRPDGQVVVQNIPWDRFAAAALNDTRGQWIERA
jgi:hypothetical protein